MQFKQPKDPEEVHYEKEVLDFLEDQGKRKS
jgi:hypothetical protein